MVREFGEGAVQPGVNAEVGWEVGGGGELVRPKNRMSIVSWMNVVTV